MARSLHDFQGVREDDLASTSHTTGDKLPAKLDPSSLRIHSLAANEVVHGELDRFLRRNSLDARYHRERESEEMSPPHVPQAEVQGHGKSQGNPRSSGFS